MAVHQYSVFIHDSAPCHESKSVQSYPDEKNQHAENIPDLTWLWKFAVNDKKIKLQKTSIAVF